MGLFSKKRKRLLGLILSLALIPVLEKPWFAQHY